MNLSIRVLTWKIIRIFLTEKRSVNWKGRDSFTSPGHHKTFLDPAPRPRTRRFVRNRRARSGNITLSAFWDRYYLSRAKRFHPFSGHRFCADLRVPRLFRACVSAIGNVLLGAAGRFATHPFETCRRPNRRGQVPNEIYTSLARRRCMYYCMRYFVDRDGTTTEPVRTP